MLARITIVAFVIMCLAAASVAGSFGVSPVRVDLSAKKPNGSVQITNTGDSPVTVQVQAAQWAMRGSENEYGETNDFIVNPPVFSLEPGGTQRIRIGLRGVNPAAVERSYRLILEEVPKAAESGTVAMILKLSLPIFIQPGTPVAPVLVWGAQRDDDGSLRLAVSNNGDAHDRISSVELETDFGKLEVPMSGYVLPGNSRDAVIRDERVSAARRFSLTAVSDAGKTQIELSPRSVSPHD
jgi:fimbrial chaperone protein